ncbi:hypothetical protein BUALT_Bualt06G0072700 [Buddleja alternifolia]|uniref:Fatty acyl-CoA reductase n=1 Tax=Buddleja alternifolia TaxID=168488 RepID=A0AAV6XPD5_9LAMI|nr:hypothetical protein BUALT_Bualt06G0072700 [Buddleja alternifolia]
MVTMAGGQESRFATGSNWRGCIGFGMIINSELFKCLKEKHGTSYQAFLREKLIAVAGNICEPNLGMDFDSVHAIMEEVDVIIQSAENTDFAERYDLMIDANVNGPQRLMRFAKMCKNLNLFVHVSTAFVNGEREGLFLENPMTMGENRRKDSSTFPWLDIGNEMNLSHKSTKASISLDTTKDLKRLGQERVKFYGWDNTYQLTKAMGEMVINEIRGDIPLLIIRPSVIESSYKEPFPGWIQGNRVTDPLIISYGKGQLPPFLGDPEVNLDIFCYEDFDSTPLIESSKSITKMKFFDNLDHLSKYTWNEICLRDGLKDGISKDETMVQKLTRKCKVKAVYAEQLCNTYEFGGFYKARFHIGNTQKLLEKMSEEELYNFEIDAKNIDWRKYFVEVHIPGLRKHVLNETRMHSEAKHVQLKETRMRTEANLVYN